MLLTVLILAAVFSPIMVWIAFLVVAVRKQAGWREIVRGLVYGLLAALASFVAGWMAASMVAFSTSDDYVSVFFGGVVTIPVVSLLMLYPLYRYAASPAKIRPTRWAVIADRVRESDTFHEQRVDVGDRGDKVAS